MRIISGDWRIDAEVSLRVSVTGAVTALVFPVSTFAFEDIHVRKILRVFHLTAENQEEIGTTLDWGLDAAVILGPLESIASTFGSGDPGDALVVLLLEDGRKALIAGAAEKLAPILELSKACEAIGEELDCAVFDDRSSVPPVFGDLLSDDDVSRLPDSPFGDVLSVASAPRPPAMVRFGRRDS